MKESLKLIVGLIGVLLGMAIGFVILMLIVEQVGGALWARPLIGVLVSVGLVGGGGAGVGYLSLWLFSEIEQRRKRAQRKAKKRPK